MFIIGNFLIAFANIIGIVLKLYLWVVIARAILSWINPAPYNDIVRQIIQAVYSLTDPVLNQIRKRLPVTYGGIDFSPIVVFLLIIFLEMFLVKSLIVMGYSLL